MERRGMEAELGALPRSCFALGARVVCAVLSL